jgi:hypothetical protein
VGGGIRSTYHVASDEPLRLNVYTPNVLGGVKFIYDTGAQYVYINYDTARLLFGPDFFDINRKRVVKMGSVDAYGAVNEEEYLFPPVKLQVAHPGTRVRSTIHVSPIVAKGGLNLLGIKAISQLPFDIVFDPANTGPLLACCTLPVDW